ncbi:MAG: type II toxin-antitoxin system RelE/ParE family toxin [Sporichthyaceae bacterium]
MSPDPDAASSYDVVLAPGARRALTDTLPSAAAFAAWEFIRGPLAESPRVVGTPLGAPVEGMWRARRGDYRVRYRIDDSARQVVVLDVDHRRDAYHG